ncbi:MAG: hypothetical protein IKQ31_01190 [Clostridia bacterium]|nr:hypothetical protein [Clostridia bacterium]
MQTDSPIKQLTTQEKKELLENIAISFFTEYPVSKKCIEERENLEKNSIYQIVLDNLIFGKGSQIKSIRDTLDTLLKPGRYNYLDIAKVLYTPQKVDVMFEKAIEKACIEADIKKNETIDKCFKMRDYLRNCQKDVSDNISVTDSNNPAASMLIMIAGTYCSMKKSNNTKTSTNTKQTSILEFQ